MPIITGFEDQIIRLVKGHKYGWFTTGVNLGGVTGASGGTGGPIGGFTGQLRQNKVTFDTSENEIWTIPISGESLVTNLDRIRFRLTTVEASGGGGATELDDLTDVTITGPATDEVLGYSGGWINRTLSEAGISPSGHIHDDRYYTEAEINVLLHDAVSVVDTASLDLELTGQTISGYVIPGGVDHDQLLNFTSTEHFTEGTIDHLNIQSIGTNSHALIDAHLASGYIHTPSGHIHDDRYVNITGDTMTGGLGVGVSPTARVDILSTAGVVGLNVKPADNLTTLQTWTTSTGNALIHVKDDGTGNLNFGFGGPGTTLFGKGIGEVLTSNARFFSDLGFNTDSTGGGIAFSSAIIGDSGRRWGITHSGLMAWGDGGVGGEDTNLYRSSANTLRTDDSFDVGGSISVTGTVDGVDVAGHAANSSIHFDELGETSDVSVGGVAQGEVLTFDGGDWVPSGVSIGTLDHGTLQGLGDDDHTQYLLLAGETTSAKMYSGADISLYSDSGSTLEIGLVGSTGDGTFSNSITVPNINTVSELLTLATTGGYDINLNPSSSIVAVTGNITITGTVDGIDVAGHATDTSIHFDELNEISDVIVVGAAQGESLVYDGGDWVPSGVIGGGGVTDHGGLTGLNDDDHTQYLLADGSRQLDGDLTFTGAQKIETTTGNLTLDPQSALFIQDSAIYIQNETSYVRLYLRPGMDGGAHQINIFFAQDTTLKWDLGMSPTNEFRLMDYSAGAATVLLVEGNSHMTFTPKGNLILNPDGTVEVTPNANFAAGIDVTGDATVTDSLFIGASAAVNNENLLIQGEYTGGDITKWMSAILKSDTASDGSLSQWYASNYDGTSFIGGLSFNAYLQPAGPTWTREDTNKGGVIFQGLTDVNKGSAYIYIMDEIGGFHNLFEVGAGTGIQAYIIFNEGGGDIDFRIESDTIDDAVFLDGETGQLILRGQSGLDATFQFGIQQTVATGPLAQFNAGFALGDIEGWGDDPVFTMQYLDYVTGGWAAVLGVIGMNLYHNDASDDWRMADTSQDGMYFEMITRTNATWVTTEIGYAEATTGTAGLIPLMNLTGGTGEQVIVIFNDFGEDHDFRVESADNENMLFIDGENNQVIVGADTNLAGGVFEVVAHEIQGNQLSLFGYHSTGNSYVGMTSYGVRGTRASPSQTQAGDWLMNYGGRGYESTNPDFTTTRALLYVEALDNFTSTVAGAKMVFQTSLSGQYGRNTILVLGDEIVFNEDSKDIDFRVESDLNANAIFLRASDSFIGFGHSAPYYHLVLGDGGGTTYANPTFAIRSADDELGTIVFSDGDSGAARYAGYMEYSHVTGDLTLGAENTVTMAPSVHFDGAHSLGYVEITSSTDNFDVTDTSLIFVNTASASVTIGGLSGGVVGQVVRLIKWIQANDMIIEHLEGSGTEKFLMTDALDVTWSDFGGAEFIYTGTYWMQVT